MFTSLSFIFSMLLGVLGFFVSSPGASETSLSFAAQREDARGLLQKLPLSAELLPKPEQHLPYRDWSVEPPEIDAKAALVLGMASGKAFYERNMYERLPIASLTKLATALVAVEELLPGDEVTISRRAVHTSGDFGNLVVGETLTVHDMLRAMLVASSNDAAVALAEHFANTRGQTLTELMNAKTYELELTRTRFSSVSGLEDFNNYATAEEVAKLFKTALENETLAEILRTDSVDIRSRDGRFTHRLVTSNKLLGRFDGVIAGKTGYTQGAGGSLAVLAKNNHGADDFLVVVLGSTNEETRFEAAEQLILWVNRAYRW